MAIVVELLSPSEKPLKHYVFNQDSVTIGRGYQNDLRLDDPYVCAEHVQVQKDAINGHLHFFDRESVNGVKYNGHISKGDDLDAADVLTLGRTKMRVFFSDMPVAPTLTLGALESRLSWLSYLSVFVIALLSTAAIVLAGEYLSSIKDLEASKLMSKVLNFIGILSIWPLLMGLLAKLSKKDSRIISQYNLVFFAFFVFTCLRLAEQFALFNMPSNEWFDLSMLLLMALFAFGFIWLSLFIGFHQPVFKRNLISLVLTCLLIVPMGIKQFFKTDKFSPRPSYSSVLLPPIYKVSASNDSQHFLANSKRLFAQAQRARSNEQ